MRRGQRRRRDEDSDSESDDDSELRMYFLPEKEIDVEVLAFYVRTLLGSHATIKIASHPQVSKFLTGCPILTILRTRPKGAL